ncbi:N-acetylmuramidase domain-containing protein [Paludibacterium paludis]|uniref:Peptidoglycan-binding protein n=1 Tax=Paludibacterium paludis TaxID=1225769 RepID=A0A918NXS2_9NEIS|nr:N-acetylmuramidase family protein [Paludibacterium paludis]GGY03848.1 peptidoglycan-binding protein [Paludibacterium paludis]
MVLKKGDHGSAVQELQVKLNTHGAKLAVDGWFGEATEAAVAMVQRRAGLVVDGMAGQKTIEVLRGDRDSRRLQEKHLQAAADRLGVELAAIKAVNAVESRGSGFLDSGSPVILLERHVAFQRAGAAGFDTDLLAARFPNLVNRTRGGYAGGQAEWARFDNLRSVTSQAIAIESCSWGLFQIMGYHWDPLDYPSVDEFQWAMASGEPAQLDAFVRFLELEPALVKALKSKRWAEFARLYNGPAYKENLYDAKLAQAFATAERLAA